LIAALCWTCFLAHSLASWFCRWLRDQYIERGNGLRDDHSRRPGCVQWRERERGRETKKRMQTHSKKFFELSDFHSLALVERKQTLKNSYEAHRQALGLLRRVGRSLRCRAVPAGAPGARQDRRGAGKKLESGKREANRMIDGQSFEPRLVFSSSTSSTAAVKSSSGPHTSSRASAFSLSLSLSHALETKPK
jgi:hypothetical protein